MTNMYVERIRVQDGEAVGPVHIIQDDRWAFRGKTFCGMGTDTGSGVFTWTRLLMVEVLSLNVDEQVCRACYKKGGTT